MTSCTGEYHQMKSMVLKEEKLEYDFREFERWREGDKDFLINKTGWLYKTPRSYLKQPSYYFSEVRYAYHLVTKDGFKKEHIVCENYRLSFSAIKKEYGKNNLHAQGTNILLEIFADDFFIEFDRLYSLNKDEVKKPSERVYVDLCAINHKDKIVKFIETKRIDDNGNRVDAINISQEFCLFFLHNVPDLGQKIFKNGIIYAIQAKLIVLVPKNVALTFKPEEYELRFAV
jgi:hypothetical protein